MSLPWASICICAPGLFWTQEDDMLMRPVIALKMAMQCCYQVSSKGDVVYEVLQTHSPGRELSIKDAADFKVAVLS